MASISVTHSFSNGATADASQVNQNFSDIINGLSDGSKDIAINAASFAGTLRINGGTPVSSSISRYSGILHVSGDVVGGGVLCDSGGNNILNWSASLLTARRPIIITDATESISEVTGSLYTAGGIGVSKLIYAKTGIALGGGTAGLGKIVNLGSNQIDINNSAILAATTAVSFFTDAVTLTIAGVLVSKNAISIDTATGRFRFGTGLVCSLYSPSGSIIRLSGDGGATGSIELEPSSVSGIAMSFASDGKCSVAAGINFTGGSAAAGSIVNTGSNTLNINNSAIVCTSTGVVSLPTISTSSTSVKFGNPATGTGAFPTLNVQANTNAEALGLIARTDGYCELHFRNNANTASLAKLFSDSSSQFNIALGAVSAATCSTAGAWTLGPPQALNYNGPIHLISGHIAAATPSSPATSDSGFIVISANYKQAGYGNRYHATPGGIGMVLSTSTTPSAAAVSFNRNLPGDSVSTAAVQIGYGTLEGAWTLGPASGLTASHVIRNSANDYVCRFDNTHATLPYGLGLFFTADPNDGSRTFLSCESNSTTVRCRIYSNGGIANYSANNTNLSDERMKTPLTECVPQLPFFKQLFIGNFSYLENPSNVLIGTTAQRVQALAPELVSGFTGDLLGVRESQVLWKAAKAIQELAQQSTAIKAELDETRAELAKLKAA